MSRGHRNPSGRLPAGSPGPPHTVWRVGARRLGPELRRRVARRGVIWDGFVLQIPAKLAYIIAIA
jgi:hypothetical protein